VAAEAQRRLSAAVDAQLNLTTRLERLRTENEDLTDELAEMSTRPVNDACIVVDDILNGLRSR
jgi:hypothetical protein